MAPLDSRLIFSVSSHKKIDWLNWTTENGAWVYFGSQNNVNERTVISNIHQMFQEEYLYLARSRNNSCCVEKKDIMPAISDILCHEDFRIWNLDFTSVIEFNKLGVLRLGGSDRPLLT